MKQDFGSSGDRSQLCSHSEKGFVLLEMIVALAIMALVGLMAWRGMDAMIQGHEVIDRRAANDATYTQLVRQFDRDCQEILRSDELNVSLSVASSPIDSKGQSIVVGTSAIPSIAAGSKMIWWMRHYRADNRDSWLLVGYGIGLSGLQRLTSQPLLRRAEALALWASTVRDPDLISSDLVVSYEVPTIIRQAYLAQAPNPRGLSAAGTGATSSNTSSIGTSINIIAPNQQGLQIQWWSKGAVFPVTRSCLMGGAL